MKFPQRPAEHVTETESSKLLQLLAPAQWIVRQVTERDYGIDYYIEMATPDGAITGDLISVQLKGVQGLEWKEKNGVAGTRSPSIKTSTANYWLSLPVPVFLFVADLSARDIYYVSVEDALRAQYDKLSTQETVSLKMLKALSLGSDLGLALLPWFYARERLHDQFAFHIVNLISHAEPFSQFIVEHQGRDSFMEVDGEAHLQFRALYESCRMASLYIETEWPIESLNEMYKRDRKEWSDPYGYLHEGTLDKALHEIGALFPLLVRKAIKLVTEVQGSYWLEKDPVLFKLCDSGEFEGRLRQIEDRLSRP